jgi:hypothetical protein
MLRQNEYLDYRGELFRIAYSRFMFNAGLGEERTHLGLVPIGASGSVRLQITLDEAHRHGYECWETKRAMQAGRPTAKFWFYGPHGWVRIKLRYGRSLTHHYYARTDEGYSFEDFTLRYELGDDGKTLVIVQDWCSGGRDCDGPIRTSGSLICPLADLAKISAYVEHGEKPSLDTHGQPIRRPEWRKHRETRAHDAYAAAAGY